MVPSLNILCPGQGAQAVGMGKAAVEASPAARQAFETANRVLGFDLAMACFAGPENLLNQTDISQPAIFTTSVASYYQAVERGMFDPAAVSVYAGLSLGEYTALHLAGAFSFEEGLRLVAMRGKYMQQAAVATASGMVALIGADEMAVQQLCQAAAQGDVLVAANFNAPGQIVVSGSVAACQRLVQIAEAAGFRATPLKVAGAFHSPLMQSAADQMREELARVDFSPLKKPVYSNVTARPHDSADSIKRLLVDQIVSPVRWEQTMQTLVVQANARFVELAPGRTLTGLIKRINRRLMVESLG